MLAVKTVSQWIEVRHCSISGTRYALDLLPFGESWTLVDSAMRVRQQYVQIVDVFQHMQVSTQ